MNLHKLQEQVSLEDETAAIGAHLEKQARKITKIMRKLSPDVERVWALLENSEFQDMLHMNL